LPELAGQPELARKALSTLVLAYLGQGDWARGQAALAQLSGLVNLPGLLLARAWPWLLAFLAFLGLILLGESRIEPLRTVEVVENPLPGPGSLYLFLLLALLLALGLAVLLGKALFANALALVTPYQQNQVLPSFYLFLGFSSSWGFSFGRGNGSPQSWARPRASWRASGWGPSSSSCFSSTAWSGLSWGFPPCP
jgi:hypothetical protein